MGKIWRLLLLTLLLNAALTSAALARPVYLADGGIITAQKVWQEEGRVYVLLNRDSLITFSPEEINLKKTFAQKRQSAAKKGVAKSVKVPAATVPAAPAASAVAGKPATPAATPVQSAAAPAASVVPAPAGAATAKVSQPPTTPPATATPAVVAKKPTPAPRPVAAPAPQEEGSETMALVFLGAGLLFILILIASFWKVFEKAGEAGWKSLIPIYNLFVLLKIAGCPSWWLLMFFLPLVNLYFMVVMHIRLAEKFGKSALFGFALFFLGFIFFPVLGFGSATYEGEEAFTFDEG